MQFIKKYDLLIAFYVALSFMFYKLFLGEFIYLLIFMIILYTVILIYYFNENILIGFLLILYALQNGNASKYQAIDIGFMRMDFFDLLIMWLIIILIFKMNKKNKINVKVKKVISYTFIYIFFYLIIGMINKNSLFDILYDFRTNFYLITIFYISLLCKRNEIEKWIIISGVIQSIVFLLIVLNSSDLVSGNFYRNVSYNLFLSYLSFCLALIKDIKIKSIVVVLNSFAILISQTRTIIIPMILFFIIYSLNNTKKLKVKNIILLFFIVLVSSYLIKITNFSTVLYNRFNTQNVLGEESTLNLRINSILLNKNLISGLSIIIGNGMGTKLKYYPVYNYISEVNDLEMLIPSLFYKYGMISVLLSIIILLVPLKKLKNQKNNEDKLLIFSFYCMLVGGLISGLSGYQGYFYLGIYLGLMFNLNKSKEVFYYDNCN